MKKGRSHRWILALHILLPCALLTLVQYYPVCEILDDRYLFYIALIQIIIYCLCVAWWLLILALAIAKSLPVKRNIYLLVFMPIVLVSVWLYPCGFTPIPEKVTEFVEQETPEDEIWLRAHIEGSANCTNTMLLLKDGRFRERSVCFGITTNSGTYHFEQDTFYFRYDYIDLRGSGEFTRGVYAYDTSKQQSGSSWLSMEKKDHNLGYVRYYITKLDTSFSKKYLSIP